VGSANALRSNIPLASHSTFQVLVSWRTKVSDRVSPTPGLDLDSIARKLPPLPNEHRPAARRLLVGLSFNGL
jgi:hypothetical protein